MPPQPGFRIVRDLPSGREAFPHPVVAIGNFDGVHRGHRAVLEAALTRARLLERPAIALTFEPHPRSYFRPEEPLFRLTNAGAKLRLLAATGLQGAIVLPFDATLAALSAEEFVAKVLVEGLGIAGATVGFDFHFGHSRLGSPDFLATLGRAHGFAVDVAPRVERDGRPVHSSAIRALLEAGQVDEAADLLGYTWFLSGTVIHGEKRGRELGYPTANLAPDPGCGLRHGIYAVRVAVAGKTHDGVASFGRRPTFDNGAPLLEAFLFDFSGDLYGQAMDVAFVGFIRPEQRFASASELIARMDEDSRIARERLAAAPLAVPPVAESA